MSHYKSNLRDLEFNLFEVFGADQVVRPGAVRRHGRRHRPQHPRGGRPARPRGPRGELRRRRPQPAASSTRRPTPRRCPSRSGSRTRRSWTPSSGGSTCPPSSAAPPRRGPCGGRSPRWCSAPTPRSGCTPPAPPSPTRAAIEGTEEQKKWAKLFVEQAVGLDDGAHRAGRRLGRRRRPHPGDPAGRRLLAHRGRQALHHQRRARPGRQHHPLRAGPPGRHARRRRPGHQGPVAVRRAEVPLRRARPASSASATASSPPTSSTRWASRSPTPAS